MINNYQKIFNCEKVSLLNIFFEDTMPINKKSIEAYTKYHLKQNNRKQKKEQIVNKKGIKLIFQIHSFYVVNKTRKQNKIR